MEHYVLVPHNGTGRGRLSRHGRAAVFCVADSATASALVGWSRLVGDRPAEAALAELQRLTTAGVTAIAAFVLDEGNVHALLYGGVPVEVTHGGTRTPVPNPAGQPPTVVVLGDIEAVQVEVAMAPNDPLLELQEGAVAADGFTLRHVVIAPAPWNVGASPAAVQAPPPPPVGPTGDDHDHAGHDHAGHAHDQMAGMHAADAQMADAHMVDAQMADAGMQMAQAAAPAPAIPEPPAVPVPPVATPAPAAAPLAAAPTPAAAVPAPAAQILSLTGPADDLPAAAPLPVAGTAAAPAATPAAGEVRVSGLRCSRDHFNDPRARFCAVCGIAMHQASFILTDDVRPPLGVLVFSDGSYHNIANSLLFGRDPEDDPRVRGGEAIGVALVDPGNTISRIHAEVRAVDWDVQLVDRGSTNGTFVWIPSANQWERLAPNQPRTLGPGAQIAFGRLTATFESSLRPA